MSVKIFYIYADNCPDCESALAAIDSVIQQCPEIPCELSKFEYTSKAALGIAVTNGIDDLPGFVIGKAVFQGTDYDEKRILNAIRKSSKRSS